MKFRCIVLMLVTLPMPILADVYQWTDNEGVLHFSDKKPEMVRNVNTIKTSQPKVVPSKSLKINPIVERANKLSKRQPPKLNVAHPKRHKSQVTIIKDDRVDEAVTSMNFDLAFKNVTGFDNADQLDIARVRCTSKRNSDCSTKTLINLKKQEVRPKINGEQPVIKAHRIDGPHQKSKKSEGQTP